MISVAVQHHPARTHLIPPLLDALGDAEIIEDPDPGNGSPLRTYLRALRLTPADATHRLVIQDDARPCRGFPTLMRERITEKPDGLVAFFTPGVAPHRAKVVRAQQAGHTWAALRGLWIPTVALCWPAGYAAEFVAWADDTYDSRAREQRGDDGPVGIWATRRHAPVWATVPSLVEHPDIVPSLIGRRAAAGANRARVAAAFVD